MPRLFGFAGICLTESAWDLTEGQIQGLDVVAGWVVQTVAPAGSLRSTCVSGHPPKPAVVAQSGIRAADAALGYHCGVPGHPQRAKSEDQTCSAAPVWGASSPRAAGRIWGRSSRRKAMRPST